MDRPSVEFHLSPGACIGGALALLILPLEWIAAAVTAAAVHELAHYLALKLCGVRIYEISVGAGGICMATVPMCHWQEFFCALAGPAGSLLLLLLVRWMPLVALCAGVQGLYNLLPLYPLDGGRAIHALLDRLCPGKRERIMKCIQWIMLALFAGVAFYGALVLKLGFGFPAVMGFLILKTFPRKIPCKEAPKRVQ